MRAGAASMARSASSDSLRATATRSYSGDVSHRISRKRGERLHQFVDRRAHEPVSATKKAPTRPEENELDPTR